VACEGLCLLADAKPYCEELVNRLPFWADAPDACIAVLDHCLSSCKQYSDDILFEELWESPEVMCLYEGFNGTCFSYAPEHELCGGPLQEGSPEQCDAFCQATSGAFMDDLDTVCSDACG